jgi:acyl-CoA thioester hydrolase
MGVVYYANYLAYFEVGRVEFLRAAGADYRSIEDAGAVAAVTRAECRYLAPARFDDLLAVYARAATMGRASMRFEYQIRREPDGTLLAEGYTEHACLDRSTLRPTRLPAGVREAVERFQGAISSEFEAPSSELPQPGVGASDQPADTTHAGD